MSETFYSESKLVLATRKGFGEAMRSGKDFVAAI
jgi:hypothetical protein